jgi:hypothetical protein
MRLSTGPLASHGNDTKSQTPAVTCFDLDWDRSSEHHPLADPVNERTVVSKS